MAINHTTTNATKIVSFLSRVAEILKGNKTVGEDCGRGYLHAEIDKKKVTSEV